MKRILSSGYIKKIDSNGTDNILVETIKDLHPAYRSSRFPIQCILDDGSIDVFEHYNFTFKLKIPVSLLYIFRYYRIAIITELPEIEQDAYTPPIFSREAGFISSQETNDLYTKYQNVYKYMFNFFDKLGKQKVSIHQREYILPMGRWTEFYITINLNDLMLFLNTNLRSEMPEVKEISQAIIEYFREEFPLLASIFLQRKFPPKTV